MEFTNMYCIGTCIVISMIANYYNEVKNGEKK